MKPNDALARNFSVKCGEYFTQLFSLCCKWYITQQTKYSDLCLVCLQQNVYRREEHLATAIQRSKEARHESFLRGREEVLAQAITSALGSSGGGGGGGGGMERDPVGTNYQPRVS